MPRSAVLAIPLTLVALSASGGSYGPWSSPYAYDPTYLCPTPYGGLGHAASSAAMAAAAAAASASMAASTARPPPPQTTPRYSLPLLWTDVIHGHDAPPVRHGGHWGER